MNPNAAQKGKSFKGVVAYITHDEGHAKTSDRVLFTDTIRFLILFRLAMQRPVLDS